MSEQRWALPSSWQWAPAGDVAKIVGGGTPPSKVDGNFAEKGIPWITPADLTGYRESHISRGRRDLSERGFAGSGAQLIPAGSVLFSSRAPIGYCVIASNEVSTNQGFKSLVLDGDIDPGYVRYYFLSAKEYAESKASGTTFMELSGARVAELAVPIAPLPEQRRIVGRVDSLTARTARARKELDRILPLIARYKQRILALAAEGILTSKWRAENNASEWIRTSVAEIAETTFDGPFGSNLKSSDYVESGVRVVRLENIGSLRFIREKQTYISKAKFQTLSRHELRPDDVIFSSFVAEEIRVCLLPDDLDTIAINKADCFCIRVDRQQCLPNFLAFRLASPTSYGALKEAVHGATRPRISLTRLKQLEIGLPSLAEQAAIVRVLESAFGWLDRMAADHSAASKLLPKLDAAILGKAFRGELVPQDPNDEPASILLDRIKAEAETASKGRRARSEGVVLKSRIKVRDEVIRPRRTTKGQRLIKSRQDDDVLGKPYLAAIIKKGWGKNAQELFKSADLPVSDFYKQLAWEIDQKHIRDHGEKLEAA